MSVRNGMRPVHPGEILCEELETLGLSANELAKALDVPSDREDWSDLDTTVADGLD